MTSESRLDCHQILCLMAYSDCTGMGLVQGMGLAQWVLVPVLNQCEHFYMVLSFSFGLYTHRRAV